MAIKEIQGGIFMLNPGVVSKGSAYHESHLIDAFGTNDTLNYLTKLPKPELKLVK